MERRSGFLLLAAIPVFFVALGANSIWDANEAFYVETPRQMVRSGDYVNPTFSGEPRFNKPVLTYWVVAAFYRVLGESVAVERLAIAVGAMGILWGAMLLGRALRAPPVGILAALLLASAPRIVFFSRRIAIDVYLALFMTLALAAFALAISRPERRRRYLTGMYVAIGLGVLTKGPVAAAIPGLVGLLWLASERRLREISRLMIPAGAGIVLAIVVPWYAAVYAQHGWEYIRLFFVDENLGRFATPITTAREFWFFLPALFADILLPWAPILVIPMLTAWKRDREAGAPGSVRRLLWWWVAVIVAVFSVSASKEDLYILPAIPAGAVLVADLLARTGFGETHRGVRWLMGGLAGMCLALAVTAYVYFREGFYGVAGAYELAALLVVAAILTTLALARRAFAVAFATLAGAFVAFNYMFVARVLPDIERLKPVPPIAATIRANASGESALAFFNMDLPSLVYYADRPVAKVGTIDEAMSFFRQHREVWMLGGEPEWRELQAREPGLCVAARYPLFVAKGSDVMRRRPPPDVLLITNKCRPTG